MLALLSLGWRKTARAAPKVPRGRRRPHAGIEVDEVAAPAYRRTPIWKRLWALASASALSVLAGTLAAIAIAVGVSWTVTTLSDMLKR
jgi:hypothetical protein